MTRIRNPKHARVVIRYAEHQREQDTAPAPVVKPVTTALEWDLRRSLKSLETKRVKGER